MKLDENTRIIKLADKRNLGWTEFGSLDGKAVIYFHGFPGSRLEVQRFDALAKQNNYRLIAVDRPGMGLSSIDKNRTMKPTVEDIIYVADYLQLDKFSVLGHSGGAPFVTACTYYIPERLNAAAIVSGMTPFTDLATHAFIPRDQLFACKLVRTFPFMSVPMMYMTRMMLKKVDKMLEKVIKPLPEIDKMIFRDPVSRKELISACLEAFRNGVGGYCL